MVALLAMVGVTLIIVCMCYEVNNICNDIIAIQKNASN